MDLVQRLPGLISRSDGCQDQPPLQGFAPRPCRSSPTWHCSLRPKGPKETLPLHEKKIVPIGISLPHMYMKKYMHMCIGYVVFGIYPTLFMDKPGWCPGTKSLTKLPLFVLSARTASNLRNGGSTLASFSSPLDEGNKKNGPLDLQNVEEKPILELFLVGDSSGFLFHFGHLLIRILGWSHDHISIRIFIDTVNVRKCPFSHMYTFEQKRTKNICFCIQSFLETHLNIRAGAMRIASPCHCFPDQETDDGGCQRIARKVLHHIPRYSPRYRCGA
jgi:hypothetical protein